MNQPIIDDRKLSKGVLFSYAFSSLGTNCLWILNNYFLLFFYTDVIQIPSTAATVIFLIARVWDAINDPMMGVLCDRTKHKEGRARFWLKRMAAPAGICILLSYLCPNWATPAKVFWAGATYILQGMAQTAIGIPLNSLRVSMTGNRTERIKISQYMAIAGAVANFVIPAYTMPFVNMFGANGIQKGFAVLAAIVGLVYGISTFIVWKATRGYDPDTSCTGKNTPEISESKSEPTGLALIGAALKNRYCVLVCLAYCCYLLLSGIMGSTLIYYFRYNLNNESLMKVYSATVLIGGFLAILCMRLMGKRFGNAKTCMIGGVIAFFGLVIRIVTADQMINFFVAAMVLLGFGSGIVSNMMHQCILDATTYGKLKGTDNQSVVMSLFTFAQKFGQAVSSVLAAALLAAFDYTPGAEPTETILGLFYVENLIIPVVVVVVLFVIMMVINRMEKQMLQQLDTQANK